MTTGTRTVDITLAIIPPHRKGPTSYRPSSCPVLTPTHGSAQDYRQTISPGHCTCMQILPSGLGDHAQTGVMGCNNSKSCVVPSETIKRRRASLRLDLSYSTSDVEYTSTAIQKKVRTPAVTPRSAVNTEGARQRPRRLCSMGSILRVRDPSPGSRAATLKTHANSSGSTVCFSAESDLGDEDKSNSGDEDESDAESKNNSDNEDDSKDTLESHAEIPLPSSPKAECSSRVVQQRQQGISVTPDSRSRLPRKSPRTRRATLPPRLQPPTLSPAPRDLQEFLCRHRPRDEASDGGSHSRSVHHIILSNGMSYEGQLGSDGMPNGWGILTMQDGVIYEGTWRRGQVHGPGSLRLPNGNAFWGAWSDGQKQGMGTFMWADGSRYEGLYRGGKRSGYGTLLYVSQAIYKGNFECDLRHGSGRLTLPCGSYYDGQWVTDIPHGHGVYVEAGTNGERFEGSWHKGVRCGAGTLVQGAQEAADGTESRASSGSAWYSGNFEAGLPHGNGAMGYGRATFCGHIERGMWTGGGGRVDLGDEAGSFEGMWHNGLPQGRGRWCSSPNGTEVDATFKEGYSKLT